MKITHYVSSVEDCRLLQEDLNTFSKACVENKLKINVKKCKAKTFSRLLNNVHFKYELEGAEIERVNQIKDLGVIMDSRLTFVPHIRDICVHATKMLGFIFRNTVGFTSVDSLLVVHYTYVRSKLKYCSIVWDPYYKTHSY